MSADPLQTILDEIARRRTAGVADMEAELRRRVADLGGRRLDTRPLQEAFLELIETFTPQGFDLFAMPDECHIDPSGSHIRIAGVVVDQSRHQVVAQLARHLHLDDGRVEHEILAVQHVYRGGGLAVLLLDRSFAFYDTCGIREVAVHAALETGRWYWARLGFDFERPLERALVATWGSIALAAVGEPPVPFDVPARRWAQLGTGSPEFLLSLQDLHRAMSTHVAAKMGDPAQRPTYEALERSFGSLLGEGWLDVDRFVKCAEANDLVFDQPIHLGRAIMLTGIDWHGVFDLRDAGARDAFREEVNRKLKKLAAGP